VKNYDSGFADHLRDFYKTVISIFECHVEAKVFLK